MKVRIVAMMLAIVLIIVSIIVVFSNTSKNNKSEIDTGKSIVAATTTIRSEVMKDIITYTITMNGKTDSFMDMDYMEDICITFDNVSQKESFKCDYQAGKNIEKAQKLYSFNGKDYTINYDGRVVNVFVNDTQATIRVINYDKVYVKCSVDYKDLETFIIGKNVSMWIGSDSKTGDKFEGVIEGLGSIVEDNKVDIYIKTTKKILPGVSVFGKYAFEKEVEAMFVLKSMILSDGIDYYVQKVDENGKITKVDVALGEEFNVTNDGVITEYVEIFGSLEEGDKLCAEVLME